MEEAEFYDLVERTFGDAMEMHYPSKIAGVTHQNRDGSDRVKRVRECLPFDLLALVPEPDKPVDPKAIAIRRWVSGKQLGYLPARTAHDLLSRMKADPGTEWLALFRASYCAIDDEGDLQLGEVVGATIEVIGLNRERMERDGISLEQRVTPKYIADRLRAEIRSLPQLRERPDAEVVTEVTRDEHTGDFRYHCGVSVEAPVEKASNSSAAALTLAILLVIAVAVVAASLLK